MVNMCNYLGWTTRLGSCMVFQKVFTKLNESCMFTFDLDATDGLHVRYTFYVGVPSRAYFRKIKPSKYACVIHK